MIFKYPSLSKQVSFCGMRVKVKDNCDLVLTDLVPNLEIKMP